MSEAVVYVMACDLPGCGPVVKVGYAKDAYARLASIQGANPFPVEIVYVSLTGPLDAIRHVEAHVHQVLAKHRLRGEWFAVDPETATDAIEKAMGLEPPPRERRKPSPGPALIHGETHDEWLESYKRGPQPGGVIVFAPPLPGDEE